MRRRRKAQVKYGGWCDACEAWAPSGVQLEGPTSSATVPPLTSRSVFLCMTCVRHIKKAALKESENEKGGNG